MIKKQQQSGFSYFEIMITVAVVVISILPIMDSLQVSVKASEVQREYVSSHYHLMAKMEEVLAESYTSLEAAIISSESGGPPIFSDPSGSSDRRIVYLSKYDIDNADSDNDPSTGKDEVIWVKTIIANSNHEFVTLVLP
ncbi:MAG: hypothetical protein AB8D52_06910 [Gammaproteobacteria bacterium]